MTMPTEPTQGDDGPDDSSQQDESDSGEAGGSLIARLFGFGREDEDEGGRGQSESEAARAAGERAMMLNLRKMRDLRVEDVMIPRADIVSIGLDAPAEEIIAAFRESGHSRLPVYRDTLDDPLGFAHLKDLALRYGFGEGMPKFDLRELIHPMLYAPPSMPIGALLQKMQAGRVHMALVVDEYGGVDGLVTIEDLLEQIVGEIEDEHDVAEGQSFREESPGVYICNARAELPEFEEAAGIDLLPDDLDEEVDTLGGLVFMLASRIPERSEVIIHPDGHEFEVVDADARRINRLRVRLRPGAAAGAAQAAE